MKSSWVTLVIGFYHCLAGSLIERILNRVSSDFRKNLELAKSILLIAGLRESIQRLQGNPPIRAARDINEQIRVTLGIPDDVRLLPHEQIDNIIQQSERIYEAAFPLTMVYLVSCTESYIETVIGLVKVDEYDFRGWEKARAIVNGVASENLIDDDFSNKIKIGFELRNLIVHKQSKIDREFLKKTGLDLQEGSRFNLTPAVVNEFIHSLEELIPKFEQLLIGERSLKRSVRHPTTERALPS